MCTRRRSRTARPVVVSRAIGRGYACRMAATPGLIHAPDSRDPDLAGIGELDGAVGGLAELPRALDDRLEDRLLVGGRSRDDTQDFAGGRLLLEGDPQLAV